MGTNVVDNVVKMEWDASKAVYTKGGKLGRTFVYSAEDYETRIGTVTVFFNCFTAFIWADDAGTDNEDRYNAKELKSWIKDNLDEAFPMSYDNYVPIIEYGGTECKQAMLTKYGLEEFEQDIIARLNDVKPYSEEKSSAF